MIIFIYHNGRKESMKEKKEKNNNKNSPKSDAIQHIAEMDMGWVIHGLGWVGLGENV